MSVAVSWTDVSTSLRLAAHLRGVRRLVRARRAPRSNAERRLSALALRTAFAAPGFLAKWAVPAFLALGGEFRWAVLGACLYDAAALIMGSFVAEIGTFDALRQPSRSAYFFARLLRATPLLLYWGAMLVLAGVKRFGAPVGTEWALVVTALVLPWWLAFGKAHRTIRRRANSATRDFAAVPALLLAGLVGFAAAAAAASAHVGAFADALRLAACGTAAVHLAALFRSLPAALAAADVLDDDDDDEPALPTVDRALNADRARATFRRDVLRARSVAGDSPSRAPAAPKPGAGLFAAHRLRLRLLGQSERTRDRIFMAAVGLLFLMAPYAAVDSAGDAGPMRLGWWGAALAAAMPNLFSVKHPARLELFGVAPRALRTYELRSFLAFVVAPIALLAAIAAAVLAAERLPFDAWTRIYGLVGAVFLFRAGWDGLELLRRDGPRAANVSFALRLAAVAAILFTLAPYGLWSHAPSWALSLTGLLLLRRRLDASYHDAEDDDGPPATR